MIKMQIIGNLGKDAEVCTLDNGMRVISFSVAHTEKWTGKDGEKHEKTIWANCTSWRGENASIKVADFLTKGQKVYVEGEPSARAWNNNDGEAMPSLEMRVLNVELLGKNDSSNDSHSSSQSQSSPQKSKGPKPAANDDDDLPF